MQKIDKICNYPHNEILIEKINISQNNLVSTERRQTVLLYENYGFITENSIKFKLYLLFIPAYTCIRFFVLYKFIKRK